MSQKLGTAEWANPADVSERHSYEKGKIWLGRSPLEDGTPLGCDNDQHVCLVSGSRGGKGTTSIINNLCLWPGSLVVVDPKGENATVTAARRGPGTEKCKGMGQLVHVLDPFEDAQVASVFRCRYNPLADLDPRNEETIDEASRIADALVVMGDPKVRFFDEKAIDIIKGLILHVITYEFFDPSERNLMTVRTLIKRGHWKAVEAIRKQGKELKQSPQALLWASVRNNKAFDVLAEIGDSMLTLEKNNPKLHTDFLETAASHMNFLDSPAMRRNLEASDFSLKNLKTFRNGVSVYLCLPQRYMNTHYRWLRMMISLTITEMEITRRQPACGYPVLMVLDEFAGLKKMEVIEHAAAQIAGFGVKLFFILQNLGQLKTHYQENWETFLGNCGLKLFFNLEDEFSREYVSKFIGETEVVRELHTNQESSGSTDTTSQSTTKTKQQSQGGSSSHGGSTSTGGSDSEGGSTSHGGSTSAGGQEGSSESYDWGLDPLFFRNTSRFLSLFRDNERTSQGKSSGTNWQKGNNWQKAKNWQKATNWQEGKNWNDGANWSEGTSESEQTGSSHAEMRQTSHGTNESLQKRRLVTPDEIGLHFSRVDEMADPRYPGLGIALISGQRPAIVQRVNYFEDKQFEGLFKPHPDHPFIPLAERLNLIAEARIKDPVYDSSIRGNEEDLELIRYRNSEPVLSSYSKTEIVDVPIKRVWSSVVNARDYGNWMRGFGDYGPIPETFGEGSPIYRSSYVNPTKITESEAVIGKCIPGRRFEFHRGMKDHGSRLVIEITEQGKGTKITFTKDYWQSGFFNKRSFKKNPDFVKNEVESEIGNFAGRCERKWKT